MSLFIHILLQELIKLLPLLIRCSILILYLPADIYPIEYYTNPYSGDTMNFIAKGTFKAGQKWERFTKKIASPNKNNAAEKTYSLIGSEHGLRRSLIKIESVEEVKE